MSKWNVSSRIWLGFGGVLFITLLFSVQIYRHIDGVRGRTQDFTQHVWPSLYSLMQVDSGVRDISNLTNRIVLDPDSRRNRDHAAQIQANWTNVDKHLKNYEQTLETEAINVEDGRRTLSKILVARTQAETALHSVLDRAGSATKDEQIQLFRDRAEPAIAALLQATAEALSENKRAGDSDSKKIQEELEAERTEVLFSLAIPLIFALVTGYFLVRAVNRPLTEAVSAMKGSGAQINTSAMEIAATSQQQLATANEVAATTSEVVATSKQISTTLRELMQTVKSVTEVAEQTATLAGNGQSSLGRMKNTIQQIMDASASINERLGVLSEKAGNIGAVVTTITKVADQTNLLSLNAAIEAEKAGEYGRGFVVVATEIRRLADQTALATGDIEQIVKEMQSAVSAGVMGMDKFSEEVRRGVGVVQQVSDELSQIIQQVQTLTPSFEAVNEGMQSQAMGAQQISESLVQLGEASRQTVESLRQSNLAIEQLNVASRTLQDGVSKFSMVTA
jgi:methyl-accepting chemotaxis protein WspA